MSDRECNSCTKCCEGWLISSINNRPMYPGKTCYLVEVGVGCKKYEERPSNPCKTYECLWKMDLDIPEKFKPDKIGIILQLSQVSGERYISMINAPNYPENDFLEYMKQFVNDRNIGLSWRDNQDNIFIYGSKLFKTLYSRQAKDKYILVDL